MSIAQYGRYGDNQVAHVAKGELVVPKQILRKRPDLRKEIYKEIEKYGVKGKRYVVGNKSNSINPHTGHPEFFLKKILPAVTGAIGFAIGGPIGASIGAGLGSAVRGDNPTNVATSALMGFGLGGLGASAGLVGGQGIATFGKSLGAMTGIGTSATPVPASIRQAKTAAELKTALGGAPASMAGKTAAQALAGPGLGAQALQFAKDNKLLTGALGLGALGAMGAFEEDKEGIAMPESVRTGSQGMLDISSPKAVYYDVETGRYGAGSPTLQPIARKDGGDIKNFPRKTGQIDGPGTEKSDDIPAMLSDGEFVMTAQAVRGLGALNGADKDDKLEQRRKGAKMMYEMMDKFESKVA